MNKEERKEVHMNSRPVQEAGSRPREVAAVQEEVQEAAQQSQGAVQAAVTGNQQSCHKQQFHTSK